VRQDADRKVGFFLKSVARASRSCLLLDYDGTLAPFRKQRNKAFPYAGVTGLLDAIERNGRTRVVIISGRDARETLSLLAMQPSPEIWGLYGLQRLSPDGTGESVQLEEATREGLEAAKQWLDYQQLQSSAEVKVASIAIHWRGLDAPEVEEIRARTLMGWGPIAKRAKLELLHFDGGVEILPAEADKGRAVGIVLDEMDEETPACYLGDDITDESAFHTINLRGLSVLVRARPRQTSASIWLKPPEDLLDFLNRWLRACEEQDGSVGKATAALKG